MKKIILDCDPGMDDSMAIVMAVKSPELDVKAITTVNGNYPVDITAVNALKVLEMHGRTDIPVAKGMPEPMFRKNQRSIYPWKGRTGGEFPSGSCDSIKREARHRHDY